MGSWLGTRPLREPAAPACALRGGARAGHPDGGSHLPAGIPTGAGLSHLPSGQKPLPLPTLRGTMAESAPSSPRLAPSLSCPARPTPSKPSGQSVRATRCAQQERGHVLCSGTRTGRSARGAGTGPPASRLAPHRGGPQAWPLPWNKVRMIGIQVARDSPPPRPGSLPRGARPEARPHPCLRCGPGARGAWARGAGGTFWVL